MGRGKKTWIEGIKEGMKKLNLKDSDALDREEWRRSIWENHPTRAGMEKWTIIGTELLLILTACAFVICGIRNKKINHH